MSEQLLPDRANNMGMPDAAKTELDLAAMLESFRGERFTSLGDVLVKVEDLNNRAALEAQTARELGRAYFVNFGEGLKAITRVEGFDPDYPPANAWILNELSSGRERWEKWLVDNLAPQSDSSDEDTSSGGTKANDRTGLYL